MKTTLFPLIAAVCALAVASATAEVPVSPALRFEIVQQETAYLKPTWSDELARRLMARTAAHKSLNVTHNELNALSDEIWWE